MSTEYEIKKATIIRKIKRFVSGEIVGEYQLEPSCLQNIQKTRGEQLKALYDFGASALLNPKCLDNVEEGLVLFDPDTKEVLNPENDKNIAQMVKFLDRIATDPVAMNKIFSARFR